MTQSVAPCPDGHHTILYGFSGWDPYVPAYKTDFIAAGVFDMIRSRGGELTPWLAKSLPVNDETFQNLLGAERPKLQLVRRVQVARTAEEAARLFAALPGPTSTTVLLSDDPQVVAPLEPVGREPAGTVEVETFSANRLRIRVAVEGKDPAWLVYADAWHPGWRCNGRWTNGSHPPCESGVQSHSGRMRNPRRSHAIRSATSHLGGVVLCPDRNRLRNGPLRWARGCRNR